MPAVAAMHLLKKKSGGFKRVGLFTKFKGGQSAAESLEKITASKFTPCKDKFICNECSLTVKSLDTKKTQLEEVEVKFRKMKQPGSYISTKIIASPSHRRTPKKTQSGFHSCETHSKSLSKGQGNNKEHSLFV